MHIKTKKRRIVINKVWVFLIGLIVLLGLMYIKINAEFDLKAVSKRVGKNGVNNINSDAIVLFDYYYQGEPLKEPLDKGMLKYVTKLGWFFGYITLNVSDERPVLQFSNSIHRKGYHIYIMDPRDEKGFPEGVDVGELITSNIAVKAWKK